MHDGLSGDLSGLGPSGRVVVGFSGGADSAALAHWLSSRVDPARLVLAHVNHGLRGKEADRDEAAARAFAQELGLRFAVYRADVRALSRERGIGLEECGRAVRYGFFGSLAPGEDDRILTAHTADDNAETVLLHLCRGAGLSGLCGIPYRRGKVLRPFLRVTRREVEEYCREHRLPFVTDSTNFSGEYARNRIRLEVLPILRELNPRVVRALSQTTELLGRDRDFLQGEAEALLSRAQRPWGLDAETLRTAHGALRSAALKQWLEGLGCRNLERCHLDAAEDCLFQGGAACLPGGVTVRRSAGLLCRDPEEEPPAFSLPVELPAERSETRLPGGKTLILEKKPVFCEKCKQKIHNLDFKNALDYDIITGTLTARTRRAGDRFAQAGRAGAQSLKEVFREMGVPAGQRGGVLLLECGGQLAFCEGAGASREFRATEKSSAALLVSVRP